MGLLGPMSRHDRHYRKAGKVNEVIAVPAAKILTSLMVRWRDVNQNQ